MSFFRSIEKLRNKSEQDRRAISLVGASVMFSLIFFIWLTTFQLRSEKVENEEMYNELSPVASLKNMSSRFFGDIKEELNLNKNDEPTGVASQGQTETAATGAAAENIFDKKVVGTTTEDIFFEDNEENKDLSGTSSDKTQTGTSSDNIEDGEVESSGVANPTESEDSGVTDPASAESYGEAKEEEPI